MFQFSLDSLGKRRFRTFVFSTISRELEKLPTKVSDSIAYFESDWPLVHTIIVSSSCAAVSENGQCESPSISAFLYTRSHILHTLCCADSISVWRSASSHCQIDKKMGFLDRQRPTAMAVVWRDETSQINFPTCHRQVTMLFKAKIPQLKRHRRLNDDAEDSISLQAELSRVLKDEKLS